MDWFGFIEPVYIHTGYLHLNDALFEMFKMEMFPQLVYWYPD